MIKDILKKKIKFKNRGFTLAEILVTLSIIGIIAAILFPSILANYTERTLAAKRQAFIARMSQAMGEMADTFPEYEDTADRTANTTLKFVNEGLSKVYKISAVCDYATLASCDIPETVTRVDGSVFNLMENSKSLADYSPEISAARVGTSPYTLEYNVDSAGFITKNGESVLVFFYPRCISKPIGYGASGGYGAYVNSVCVNMVFDLNGGKQKPNRINEDIGFMTIMYSNMPYVVAPKVVPTTDLIATANTGATNATYAFNSLTYDAAKQTCAGFGENVRIPSYEELSSLIVNYPLYSSVTTGYPSNNAIYFWTSTQFMMNGKIYNKILEADFNADQLPADSYSEPTVARPFICIQDN